MLATLSREAKQQVSANPEVNKVWLGNFSPVPGFLNRNQGCRPSLFFSVSLFTPLLIHVVFNRICNFRRQIEKSPHDALLFFQRIEARAFLTENEECQRFDAPAAADPFSRTAFLFLIGAATAGPKTETDL